MFYIKTPNLPRKEIFLLQLLPSTIVVLAFVSITLVSWSTAKNNVKEDQQKTLRLKSSVIETTMTQRLRTYEDLLRGAAGLFDASEQVTATEWAKYFTSYDLINRHPATAVVGYSKVFLPGEQSDAIRELETRENRPVPVFPPGDKLPLSAVTFIEPSNSINKNILGYNMYSDPLRRSAMDKARDSNKVTISNLLSLQNLQGQSTSPMGFIMLAPIYRNGSTHQTIENRRNNITGFVYTPFQPADLLDTQTEEDSSFGFSISKANDDGTPQRVYATKNLDYILKDESTVGHETTFSYAGLTQWTISAVATDKVVNTTLRTRPSSVLWGGAIFSFLVGAFVHMLLVNRSRALANREEKGIQSAKDELLALASHQLRTPATGVKQYIGMLKEGYAGKLTQTQIALVEKAYASNERQLSTINEMLVVARADAGHLKRGSDIVNISELLQRIVDDLESTLRARQQVHSLKEPEEPLFVVGSRHYLQMALENIVNNATKYTKPGGKVDIILTKRGNDAVLYVKDTGVGVAPKDQHLLFKKFSRIPNELTNRVVGSGIGLYLAKKVIVGHKGSIRFESKQDQGSLVTIVLPQIKP